jgi:hypothetical protein
MLVPDVEHAAGQPPSLPQLQYEGFEPSPFKADDSHVELEDLKPVCPLLIEILNSTHLYHRLLSQALVVHQSLTLAESNILYLHLFYHLSSARICLPWD